MSKSDKKEKPQTEEVDQLQALSETEDFRTYLRIAVATGELKEADFATMDENEKDLMVEGFEAWVKSGKPTPKMPEVVSKQIEVIHSIAKVKKGRDVFVTYNVKGEDRKRNVNYVTLYGKRNDGSEDQTLVTGERLEYEVKFDNKEVEALLKKAKLRNPDVKLSIERDGQAYSYSIHNEANFFKPFDEIFEKGSDRKMI
jgi:hypothetical protein